MFIKIDLIVVSRKKYLLISITVITNRHVLLIDYIS